MWIAEAARAAGVNPQTLRYYERRGLLKAAGRRRSGYREYAPDDVRRLRFVKRAQDLGFSLEDVRELLALRDVTPSRRAAVRAIAARRAADLSARIADLQRMRDALEHLVSTCHASRHPECPILEALEPDLDATVEPQRRLKESRR
jgi:Cu(I)-responsive transcriptional regulator